MIKVKAKIKLYKNLRKTPFTNGYRTMFNFVKEMKTSGNIKLIDRDNFFPGDEGEVEINFLSKTHLRNDFNIGKKFSFGEGEEPLGEGEILEIV